MGMMDPELPSLDNSGLIKRCHDFLPSDHVPDFVKAYEKARPGQSPTDVCIAMNTDRVFRIPALRLIESQQRYQPVYNYLFNWKSPIMDGQLGACHILEIGFVFGAYTDEFCGSGPGTDRLSSNIQDAWLAFARTGNPSHDGIGTWPCYGDNRMTMLLGEECRIAEAVFEQERGAWDEVPDEFTGQI